MSLPPFDQVVADYGALVWRVCRALVGSDDAEDAWSETFLAALAGYDKLRPDSNIAGWLVTIAHRKAVDRLRAAYRAPVPIDPPPDQPAVDTDPAWPDEVLWVALAALPPKQRQAVAYHHVAGLAYAEVAAICETTEVAARRAASDGIASLRRRMNQEDRA